jgi:high-affinity Fe2+/Pb2+ permease
MPSPADKKFGEMLALVIGILLVLGGLVNVLAGGEIVVTTILVLIGAGALSGYVQARKKRLNNKS